MITAQNENVVIQISSYACQSIRVYMYSTCSTSTLGYGILSYQV